MTSILRGVDSFDTADAVATDDNGLAGNYEVILPVGNYTSGTYSYPNGRTEADYALIVVVSSQTGPGSGYIEGSTSMIEEVIAMPWVQCINHSDGGQQSGIVRVNSTSFSAAASGVRYLHNVTGYLKEGVI
jgi:hypothetical protein